VSWVTWLSPLGWVHQVQAYHVNRWWVFAPVAVGVLVLVAAAFALSARRDLGAGLLPSRLGPAQGAPGLRTPLALAWRLHRGMLVSCVIGFLVLGLLGGGVAQSAGDLVKDNQQLLEVMQRLGGRSAGDSDMFIAGMLKGIVAILVTAYAIAAALRMRTEEASLRSESLLATGVSRLGWAGSHLTFALLGPALGMAAAGLAAGLFYGAAVGDVSGQVPRILAGALVQLPAIWLLTGLTIAAFGALPQHASAVGWVALVICVVLGQVGAALQLSQAWLDVSPFTHIPPLPGGVVTATPLVVLTFLSAALVAVGLVGLRRRDIPST
jgi:ABC-2 type transport system permease protein